MLKGNIESVTKDSVSGWAYLPNAPMREMLVQAFVGQNCVATGRIDVFRQDLADAGLGDGYLGFHVELPGLSARDRRRLFLRVADSDAVLVRNCSALGAETLEDHDLTGAGASLTPATLDWMLERGWFSQAEYDFVKFFTRMGVFDCSLRPRRDGADGPGMSRLDPELAAEDLFSLWAMQRVVVQKTVIHGLDEIASVINPGREDCPAPIYALYPADRCKIGVAEASHLADEDLRDADVSPFIDYPVGPDHLLVLHARSLVRTHEQLPTNGVLMFFARRAG